MSEETKRPTIKRPKKYESDEERARRAFVLNGRAPIEADIYEAERDQFAALVADDGTLVEGGNLRFREILVAALDKRKASDAELDEPTETIEKVVALGHEIDKTEADPPQE